MEARRAAVAERRTQANDIPSEVWYGPIAERTGQREMRWLVEAVPEIEDADYAPDPNGYFRASSDKQGAPFAAEFFGAVRWLAPLMPFASSATTWYVVHNASYPITQYYTDAGQTRVPLNLLPTQPPTHAYVRREFIIRGELAALQYAVRRALTTQPVVYRVKDAFSGSDPRNADTTRYHVELVANPAHILRSTGEDTWDYIVPSTQMDKYIRILVMVYPTEALAIVDYHHNVSWQTAIMRYQQMRRDQ